jgi:hypothetical protein
LAEFWIYDFGLVVAMAREYIIYCDESESKGRHFSNFYGGALVNSEHIDGVRDAIANKKRDLNLFGEIKWSKITVNYRSKYIDLIDLFFDLVKDGKIKIRIMFTQNIRKPRLTAEQIRNQYAILYYLFVRHAFGLIYSPTVPGGVRVRIYPDEMPLTREEFMTFRNFVTRLSNRSEFKMKRIQFAEEDITQVVSHDHDVLQCLDVVLGAINFRLTRKHKDKAEGKTR